MVEYNRIDGIKYGNFPGLQHPTFRCQPREATLSIPACVGMFQRAQAARGREAERYTACKTCSVGAAHTGVELILSSWLFDTMICPRCGHGTMRMIRNRACVSCYNREREVKAGRNAKGKVPSKLAPLIPVEVAYTANRTPRRYRSRHAVGAPEVMAHIMRTVPGQIIFHFKPEAPHITQGRLL